MNKKDVIYKDNSLINASYRLGLVEQRLILLAILEIRKRGIEIDAVTPIVITAESYMQTFNVLKNAAYESLTLAASVLYNRSIFFEEKDTEKQKYTTRYSRWVSEISYIENQGKIELIFAPRIIPLLTNLNDRFTRYNIEQISRLDSLYAIRLYELMMMWKSTNGTLPYLTLEELRNRVGLINNEYARMTDFKKRVLDLAVDQINTHTDIIVSYEQVKSGRVIVGFKFKFKFKDQAKQGYLNEQELHLSSSQIEMFSVKLAGLKELEHLSLPGESYADLTNKIKTILQDPSQAIGFKEYLLNVGYKPK